MGIKFMWPITSFLKETEDGQNMVTIKGQVATLALGWELVV
jgi:hypothetical protein